MVSAPIYSKFSYIFPGPHYGLSGEEDTRVWFSIPTMNNPETGVMSFLIFPAGGRDDEVREISLDPLTLQIS